MELGKLAGAEFELDERTAGIEIGGITANSREVRPGYLFAALAGTRFNGLDFVADAVANGAACVLAGEDARVDSLPIPGLTASEPRRTLARMAARFYPGQPACMAAVTGTAGKTSVTAFLRQIWEKEGKNAASIGTIGVISPGRTVYGNLTTPDPVHLHKLLEELAGDGVTHAAIEASSHGLDQYRLDGVRISAAGFTNLGRDHMDYHKDTEDYFRAKMRLFGDLTPKGSPAVIFADDPFSARTIDVCRKAGLKLLTVGRGGQFLSLKRVEHERFRQIAEIQSEGIIYRIEFPLAGDFQIANALVAAGIAIATGSKPGGVMAALAHLEGAPGRLELVGRTTSGSPVYVDYAHKPEAMENVLKSLRPFTTGKLVMVFGCGGDRDPGKRPIMGEIAKRLADVTIVTDDNPRTEDPAAIRAAIMAACPGAVEIADRRLAIETAIRQLGKGDALVIAGKGHEEGQIIGARVLPFSDHKVVRELLSGTTGSRAGGAHAVDG
jgi:UDP-N-acetylmuramoyl-L-alanyl-D-glutamate--2,6-diaminopimelate ligase